jgi:hypothetical protein
MKNHSAMYSFTQLKKRGIQSLSDYSTEANLFFASRLNASLHSTSPVNRNNDQQLSACFVREHRNPAKTVSLIEFASQLANS